MSSSLLYRLKVCAVLLVSLLLMAGNGTCGNDKCTIGDDKASLIYVVKDAKKEPKGASLSVLGNIVRFRVLNYESCDVMNLHKMDIVNSVASLDVMPHVLIFVISQV